MAKIARFDISGSERYGVVEENTIRQIDGSIFGNYQLTETVYSLDKAKLLAPCLPPKILAVGLNYRSHLGNRPAPESPIFFLKATTALTGPESPIVIPKGVSHVDAEGELVVVIKQKTKGVSEADALSCVLGYTCGNDVSAREFQRGDGQWMRAKSIDTFSPLGPWIVDRLDPANIELETRINGQVVQHSNTSDLIFNVPFLISYISKYITLHPGDLIYTGTPGTTGTLKDGDKVEITLGGIGTLTNPVKEA
ncbi:MAG: fumarylacetoacetate hydrolase family protein [Candidatus Tectomicrobia bacterium]|nr:fumarylacetoacetate hydrolase family protein [Candidatus Tectomicrobia bacterium]